MAQSELVSKLREAYQKWHDNKGASADHWMDLLADNVSFESLAEGRPGADFSKRRMGRSEIVEYFEDIAKDWSMNDFSMNDFIEEGNRIVAIGSCSWTHKKTHNRVDTPKVDIWTFENGKAVKFAEFYDTAKVFAAVSC
jgi:ketosteroid isomerase-like protein